MIGHPITGSFHWDIKLVKIGLGDNWKFSTIPHILTDTGTTLIYFPPGKFKGNDKCRHVQLLHATNIEHASNRIEINERSIWN